MLHVRHILAPILLCFQLLMVAGGPVLAQYCCGQRVQLEAECAPESCCIEIESCCDATDAESPESCCEDDAEFEVEFTYVGSLDAAAVSLLSILELQPSQTELPCHGCAAHRYEDRIAQQAMLALLGPRPPDLTTLGVWRL